MPAFQWTEFLDLATRLEKVGTEAERRSAISRAYYAAFHHARKYLDRNRTNLGNNKLPETGQAHELTSSYLENHSNKKISALAITLSGLRKVRNSADYKTQEAPTALGVSSAITQAKAIIRVLDEEASETTS